MSYWVNVDRPTGKVTLHEVTGPHRVDRPKHPKDGWWGGPFPTGAGAASRAGRIEKNAAAYGQSLRFRKCGTCFR